MYVIKVEPNMPRLTYHIAIDKEVEGYYDDGMTVPDDITLLWTDDKYVPSISFLHVRPILVFLKLGKYTAFPNTL